jgi:tape measure domain-containing protein
MTTKKVQPVTIKLDIKGGEQVAKLKSSFRDLTKTVGQTDSGIEAARKSVIEYGKTANQSEAVVKGQIKAFEGLREQAQMGGKVYQELSNDIATLKSQLNGSTPAIDAQRKALIESADSARVTRSQLIGLLSTLSALQKQTTAGSKAFAEIGADIANLESKIIKAKAAQEDLNRVTLAGNQAAAGGAAATRLQIKAIDQKVASLREEKQQLESLKRQEKARLGLQTIVERPGDVPFRTREYIQEAVAGAVLGENVTQKFGKQEIETAINAVKQSVIELQSEIEVELARGARRTFQEMARDGRESARSLAQAFSGPEFERIFSNLDKNVGELPNTTAGLSQRLRELERVLNNTARSGDDYVTVALKIAQVQREASAATQGLGAALLNDLASGAAVRSQKNLREVIGQLQAEMSELNTETAEGSAKYAENARQVNRLQKELDQISNSYRTVADVARQAGIAMGGSLNPFSASGAKNPAFMREREKQEMEQIAELQKVINDLADEHVGSLRSAARTMDEYEQKLGDDIVRRYEEETAAQDKAYQNRIANEEDAFRKELERLNTLSQARKAAASAMGIGGREDISSLYQGIIGLSTADIRRQQEMMGKSAAEVFNDIATAFEKGGRAVDLKGKSTSIGDDIAEGVVDGASKSSEIAKGAKDFASRLISAYKKAFKIQSPSKETEQKIGVPLGLGIIKGLISALKSNKNEVKKEIEQIIDPGLPRSRSPRSLIGSVNELKATNFGFAYRSRPATPGYRPLGSNVRLDSEIERMFNQFRVNIAALTTDAEIYYNLLQSLPSSRLTTNLASAASRRAAAAEIPGFIESQRLIGPGELEREISTAVAQYLRDVRPTDPWVGITADYKRFVDAAVAQSERLRASTVRALPGVRVAGALPPASQDITPAQQQRIERAYRRSSQRSLSVLAEDAFRDFGTPGLPASSFGFMADPARIGRFSGIGRALPPAIDVAATSVESGSQNLRDSVRDFFNRISQGVRSSFSGAGGGSGRGRGFSGGLGGGGGASGNFERLNTVLQRFGPLSNRSTADIQELGASLRGLGDILSPLDQDFDRVNKAIIDQSNLIDRELQKRERRMSRRRMSPMQMTQAAGAVLSGGIFGGPEGFVGGAAGALAGGVGGAFAGAAIGAQVGGIRRTLGEYADYAAQITRLNIALEGIAGSQAQYNRALQAATDVTAQLNVPQEVAIQGMTRLVAAVKGAGGGVAEAEIAFKNINSAIIATGGGAEQVQGAVTALVQIFSKGKVSAEEINQIAERLPGTFNKIAEASGRTGPELTKALQQGTVGLNDLMKFLVSLGDEYGELAEKIAGSSENAGARLQVAFNQMRIEVGNALQPIGAEFQNAFTEFIEDITPTLVEVLPKIGEFALVLGKNLDVLAAAAGGAAAAMGLLALASVKVAIPAGVTGLGVLMLKAAAAAGALKAALAGIALLNPFVLLGAGLAAATVGIVKYYNSQKELNELLDEGKGSTEAIKDKIQEYEDSITKATDKLKGINGEKKATSREASRLKKEVIKLRGELERLQGTYKIRLEYERKGYKFGDKGELTEFTVGNIVYGGPRGARARALRYVDGTPIDGGKGFGETEPTGGGSGSKGPKSQLDKLLADFRSLQRAQNGVLEIEGMRQTQAQQLARATADNNQKLITTTNLNNISLDFAEQQLQIENKLLDDLDKAAGLEIEADRRQAEKNARLEYEIKLSQLLEKSKGAIAFEEQRAAIAAEQRQKALDDEIFGLRDQLGLVTDDERIARFRGQAEEKYGADDPRVGEAVDLFRQQIDPTFLEGIQQAIRSTRDELETLIDPINQVTGAATAIGEAFSKSFMDTITGASTAREGLASFFRNVGNYFLDLAGNIIAKLIEIAVLESLTSVFGGGSAGGSGILSRLFGFKDGGVVKDIQPYAKGGIVDKPTLFRYASGGTGRFGLMGEAGPEAIMPLRRGANGKLGVEASAGVGDIIVNVDASDSAAQGDGRQAQQLGKAIGAAVQAELIKQKRPGGLLS